MVHLPRHEQFTKIHALWRQGLDLMFERFLPARNQKNVEAPIQLANLDKILTRKYIFVLHGKEHTVSPPDIKGWLQLAEDNNALWALGNKETVSPDEFVDAYYTLISRLCPTITREDIKNSTQSQVSALWQMVLDMQNGFAQKKTLVSMALQGMSRKDVNNLVKILSQYESTLPESLPSSQESSAGRLT